MRKDMAKVIVERPRIKPYSTRKGRRFNLEDLPTHEGMRRAHALRGDCKELNENLAPLRRYLAKQVGRPWDKVYSEISARLCVDSTVQQHVRDHLRDFVAITPRRNIRSWQSGFREGLWWQRFYVDPTTRLLCSTDRLPEEKARRRAKQDRKVPPLERVVLDNDYELRMIKGLWYEVQMAAMPEPVYRTSREIVKRPLHRYSRNSRIVEMEMDVRRLISPAVLDVVTRTRVDVGPLIDNPENWKDYRRTRPERRYAIAKRVLSRRELRQRGLRNSTADDK